MVKKALLKAILVVLALAIYMVVGCIAVETENTLLMWVMLVPLVIGALCAVGVVLYDYFKEDEI